MKFYSIVIILSLLESSYSLSNNISFKKDFEPRDTVITLTDKKLNITLQISIDCDTAYYGCTSNIDVFDSSKTLMQNINSEYDIPLQPSGPEGLDWFELVDLNFDGVKELAILTGIWDNGTNAYYQFWQYDTSTSKYIYSEIFTNSFNCNYDIDEFRKTITTYTLDNRIGNEFTEGYYIIKDGIPQLMRSIQQKIAPNGDLPKKKTEFIRTLSVRVNEKMIVEKEYRGTWDELEKLIPTE
jgi:hypothetical protein